MPAIIDRRLSTPTVVYFFLGFGCGFGPRFSGRSLALGNGLLAAALGLSALGCCSVFGRSALAAGWALGFAALGLSALGAGWAFLAGCAAGAAGLASTLAAAGCAAGA